MNGGTAAKSIPLGTIRAKGLTPTLTDLKKLETQLRVSISGVWAAFKRGKPFLVHAGPAEDAAYYGGAYLGSELSCHGLSCTDRIS
jgi:hypothetical protein